MSNGIAPLILFDLDGTLLDSARDLHAAMNILLAEKSELTIDFEEFRPVVSKGARAMLKQSFSLANESERELLLPEFLATYEKGLAEHSIVFDGVNQVLEHIEAQGSQWGIVTNKPYYLAEPLIEKLGWSSRSVILLGGDSLPKRKPEPDQLLFACQKLDIAPEQSVYVGDDERDVIAANRAGMRSIAALWGYRPADDLPDNWGADDLAEYPLQLLEHGLLKSL
ncbi:MAG TPA: phosphoglycolate phosphatase [Arenimonas sp.]|nr:phosphoglycolate phosphatase [Arenimonas sp.]